MRVTTFICISLLFASAFTLNFNALQGLKTDQIDEAAEVVVRVHKAAAKGIHEGFRLLDKWERPEGCLDEKHTAMWKELIEVLIKKPEDQDTITHMLKDIELDTAKSCGLMLHEELAVFCMTHKCDIQTNMLIHGITIAQKIALIEHVLDHIKERHSVEEVEADAEEAGHAVGTIINLAVQFSDDDTKLSNQNQNSADQLKLIRYALFGNDFDTLAAQVITAAKDVLVSGQRGLRKNSWNLPSGCLGDSHKAMVVAALEYMSTETDEEKVRNYLFEQGNHIATECKLFDDLAEIGGWCEESGYCVDFMGNLLASPITMLSLANKLSSTIAKLQDATTFEQTLPHWAPLGDTAGKIARIGIKFDKKKLEALYQTQLE